VVTVDQIRYLREQTGVGLLECKLTLQAANGDLDKAIDALRIKGHAQAAKRSDRAITQGLIECYIHTGGRVGALVELACETDFVARTSEFQELAHDIAMQVAAMAPAYLNREEIAEDETRPAAQVSLLLQPFIKDNSKSVSEMVEELAAKVGENIKLLRFARLALGE
jgi:elongation factor Ts